MTADSRIDFELVRAIAAEFPNGGWHHLPCSALRGPRRSGKELCRWAPAAHLDKRAGNYAFLFPASLFAEEKHILLHGPSQSRIPFHFSAAGQPLADGMFVAYVGKATNLQRRLKGHFGGREKTTEGQVQLGLVAASMCKRRSQARGCMLEHATIVYCELPGDENTANRDLLELSLCAAFAPPFNIKSER